MSYKVKEAFLSIQGEGARAGRAAVFCRFSGCNLWSGREEDRAAAICGFCDTDFLGIDGEGGGEFADADSLAKHLAAFWPGGGAPYLVFTGGEPSLQLDAALIGALKSKGFELAIETNGANPLPSGLDWITVSPKPGAPLRLTKGDELKLVYPAGLDPGDFENLDFSHFFIQALDDDKWRSNTEAALDYCLRRPRWRLSLQIHKIVGAR